MKKIRVKIERNYSFPDLFRQTPASKGIWGDLEFVYNDVDECDVVVVFNHPSKDLKIKHVKNCKFLFLQEPPLPKNNYLISQFKFYDSIVGPFQTKGYNIKNVPSCLPWHINKDYDFLTNLRPASKINKVSWITSNNRIFPEHTVRMDFIDFLKANEFDFDLFGRGFTPIDDKFDSLFPYKYTIASENYIGNDYYTEKIIDAFLSWTVPIYYGSPNITKYFPERSMIQVDLKKPELALEKINEAIATNFWDKNIEYIQEARELVLNKYQFFPFFKELVLQSDLTNMRQSSFLPFDGLTRMERFKKRIKKLVS